MKRTISLLAFSLMLFLAQSAYSQAIPINEKFGKISDQELNMTSYPLDTSAVAVVLFEHNEQVIAYNNRGELKKTDVIHKRIKILKDAGKKYADHSFYYPSSVNADVKISDLKVSTFNKEGGKIVETKMSKKFYFDQKYNDKRNKVSFTAQNVVVGSVVEYTYTITSNNVLRIDDVFFQDAIPVNYMTAIVAYPEYLTFSKSFKGYYPVKHSTNVQAMSIVFANANSYNYNLFNDSYSVTNVPKLEFEDYVIAPLFYLASVTYDLTGTRFPNSPGRSYNTSWSQVDKMICDELKTHNEFTGSCKIKDDVDKLKENKDLTEEQFIAELRNIIGVKVKWNEVTSFYPTGISKALKSGTGNSADINILMATALNYAGYKAEPVFLKFRTAGPILGFHPSADQYDTYIIRITTPSGEVYYLDAKSKNGYLNVLPDNYLVENARYINEDGKGSWVDLSKLSRSNENIVVNYSLTEEKGSGTVTWSGYNAASQEIKNVMAGKTDDEYKAYLEKKANIEITNLEYLDKKYSPQIKFKFDFEQDVQLEGVTYFKPFLIPFHKRAFKDEKRIVPIDFVCPKKIVYTFNLTIPEGYMFEEIPKSVKYNCEALAGSVTVLFKKTSETTLTVNYIYSLGVYSVPQSDYEFVRSYWEKLVDLYDTQIVIKEK